MAECTKSGLFLFLKTSLTCFYNAYIIYLLINYNKINLFII